MVGSFLVSQALSEERPLAVLARDKGPIPAAKRLPTGLKILKGDLTLPLLGLSDADLAWLKANCSQVIHAGASVKFMMDQNSGEPFRSNIDGTRQVLQLCRQLEIKRLAYVSTAYVCGDRSGLVKEEELESSQSFNNPYEQSKYVAESLIHQADFLERAHIFRPSVVVGDSKTGATPAFPTIYELFKLAWALPYSSRSELLDLVKLKPETSVNLVPVDWVADAIWQGLEHPGPRKTFHLTHPKPVELGVLLTALEQFREGSPDLKGIGVKESPAFQPLLGYLRQHPVFESSVTQPPPDMTREILNTILRYAVERRFVAPRIRVELDDAIGSAKVTTAVGQLKVSCLDSSESFWNFEADRPRRVAPTHVDSSVYLRAPVFEQLLNRELNLKTALASGRVTFEAEEMEAAEHQFQNLLNQLGAPA